MNADFAATALSAEDEPLLAAHLAAELARLWPALRSACAPSRPRRARPCT